jgi:hypothetical protein
MQFSDPIQMATLFIGVILLNVRWYSRYSLSYRDLEAVCKVFIKITEKF